MVKVWVYLCVHRRTDFTLMYSIILHLTSSTSSKSFYLWGKHLLGKIIYSAIFFFFFQPAKCQKQMARLILMYSNILYSLAICLLLTYIVLTYIYWCFLWMLDYFSTLKKLNFNRLSSVCLAASGHRSNELKFHLCCLLKLTHII